VAGYCSSWRKVVVVCMVFLVRGFSRSGICLIDRLREGGEGKIGREEERK